MGILDCFLTLAEHIQGYQEKSLDEIASAFQPYSYIGNRKTLESLTRAHVEELMKRSPQKFIDDKSCLKHWYNDNWKTDSGVFPDFVLARSPIACFGNGALLELKDSSGGQIASFNSTLPSNKKQVGKLSPLVLKAIENYETLMGMKFDPMEERDCFYLIRTHKSDNQKTRLSIVQGTFFETLPTSELLKEVWQGLLKQTKLTQRQIEKLLPHLAELERAEIAITRQIQGASVKPRLRIMSEVDKNGNPHTYKEICPKTFNFIWKPFPDTEETTLEKVAGWLRDQGLEANQTEGGKWQMQEIASSQLFELKLIQHKRNGVHAVLQMELP